MRSDPVPLSVFAQRYQALIDRIVASEDTNEKQMLHEQLKQLIMGTKGRA